MSLRVQVLGSGNAFNEDGRGSHGIWIESAQRAPLLVDAGPTLLSAIQQQGLEAAALDRLFLTHLHGDHVAGWPFLALQLTFVDKRTRPFEIYGPQGTRACLEGLETLCYPELLGKRKFPVQFHEIPIAEQRGIDLGGGMGLDVYPLDHHPTSLGLSLELDGRRIAVSGDTRWCENLERLACDSDLLILECTALEPSEIAHVSLAELRERRERLAAGSVLLVHLDDRVAEALAIDPISGVQAAHDGTVLEL